MPEPFDVGVIWGFATALLIGALIGVERERRKSEDLEGIGLRTFILFALIDVVAGFLSRGGVPWVLLAAFLPVSALLFAGYWLVSRAQDGAIAAGRALSNNDARPAIIAPSEPPARCMARLL